jgi:hypothetical protein
MNIIISHVYICVECLSNLHGFIQGDSGRKVNILRDDIINHCEKKVHMNMRLILSGYRARGVRIYKCKNIVNGNREKLLTVDFILFPILMVK